MIAWGAFVLLCAFYGTYLWKLMAQQRQGITTNVMIRGKKSRSARRIGVMLVLATYTACGAQFFSCFFQENMGKVPVPRGVAAVGVVLMGLGIVLFVAAFLTLNNSWRAGIDEQQKTELVTSGIYRFSRNPAFVGFDLLYLGSMLAVSNWVLIAAACMAMILIHLQILEEERHLYRMFGEPYADYRRSVRRYF